jgi:NAD(P)-dependent dehydrogenase (short-subunit alcohol dehydrogenase family)
MTAPGSLTERGAVIVGGGRGIGEAVARRLAEAGAGVVVAARSVDDIDAVAATLRGLGVRAWGVPCDVADPASVETLAETSVERLATEGLQPDILINSAGIASSAPVTGLSLDEWNRVLTVNATGTFLCTRAFLPGMLERGWGRVVNIASVAGLAGARYISAYAASKHAVVGLTRCVAAEVAGRGVTINAVCPGYVDTEMTAASVSRIARKTGRTEEEALEAILEMSPHGRLIRPAEVADAVAALVAEEAEGMNGEAIVIDGGDLPA